MKYDTQNSQLSSFIKTMSLLLSSLLFGKSYFSKFFWEIQNCSSRETWKWSLWKVRGGFSWKTPRKHALMALVCVLGVLVLVLGVCSNRTLEAANIDYQSYNGVNNRLGYNGDGSWSNNNMTANLNFISYSGCDFTITLGMQMPVPCMSMGIFTTSRLPPAVAASSGTRAVPVRSPSFE